MTIVLNGSSGATGILVCDKTSGVSSTVTPANWKLIVRAWK